MTDFRINVIIDPSKAKAGSRAVERELVRINDAADRVRTTITRAFKFITAAKAVQEIGELVDTYTRLQNRLRVVTDGQAQLELATGRLLDISNRSRSSFEGTVELYSRMSLASKTLGTSSNDLLGITEAINKAIILSGASAKEASNGLIQLSQGIAANRLGGDELRSVLEQLPVVADVISKELGVTRAGLRKMGEEGTITGEVILRAFKNAREEIEGKFAKTIPTVGQGFQVLRNNLIIVAGEFDKALGSSRALSAALVFLATNMKTLVQLLLLTSSIFAAVKIAPFVSKTLAAAEAYRTLRTAVSEGNAVLLGSATALQQQAAFEAQKAAATVAGTRATINAIKTEEARTAVNVASTAAFRAQAEADVVAAAARVRSTQISLKATEREIELRGLSVPLFTQENRIKTLLNVETASLAAATERLNLATFEGNTAVAVRATQDARLLAIDAALTAETNALTAANAKLAAANSAAAVQSTFLGRALVSIKAGINSVTAAIAANPVGAALIALTAIVAVLTIFRNEIELSQGKLATLGDFLSELGSRISDVFATVRDTIEETFQRLADSFPSIFGSLEFSLSGVLRFLGLVADTVFNVFTAVANTIVAVIAGIGPAIGDLAVQAVNILIGTFEFAVDSITALFATLGAGASRFIGGLITGFTQAGIAIKAALAGNFEDAVAASEKAGQAIYEGTIGVLRDVPSTFLDKLTEASGTDLVPKLNNAFQGEAALFGHSVADSFIAGLTDSTARDFVESLIGGAETRAKARKAAEDAAKAAAGESGPATPTVKADPFGDLLKELREQQGLLSLIDKTNAARAVEAELIKNKNSLIKAGVKPTEGQLEEIRVQLLTNQALQDQVDLIDNLRSAEETRVRSLAAIDSAFARNAIKGNEYFKLQRQINEAALTDFDKTARSLEQQNAILSIVTKTNAERQVQAELQQTINDLNAQGEIVDPGQESRLRALIASNQQLERQKALVEELTPPEETLALKTETANRAFANGAINAKQYAEALRLAKVEAAEAGHSISDGLVTGFDKINTQMHDLATVTENALVGAFNSAEEALVSFANSGKFSFNDFASAIIKDITRIIARLLILKAVEAIGGAFSGGGTTAASSASNFAVPNVGEYAEGGVAQANKPYIVGEKGPELFMPGHTGSVVPHDQTIEALRESARSQSGTTVVQNTPPPVNVQVINTMDAGEIVERGLGTVKGQRKLVNQIGENKNGINRSLA